MQLQVQTLLYGIDQTNIPVTQHRVHVKNSIHMFMYMFSY